MKQATLIKIISYSLIPIVFFLLSLLFNFDKDIIINNPQNNFMISFNKAMIASIAILRLILLILSIITIVYLLINLKTKKYYSITSQKGYFNLRLSTYFLFILINIPIQFNILTPQFILNLSSIIILFEFLIKKQFTPHSN